MMHSLLLRSDDGGGTGGGIFGLVVAVLVIVSMWKIFAKAGEPGWAAIIPIYNTYTLIKIAGKPWWWLLLLLIPLVNVIVLIVVMISVAERFGKGTLFGLGMAFLPFIFYPMLGFGSSTYRALG
jgi:hypothetical protein